MIRYLLLLLFCVSQSFGNDSRTLYQSRVEEACRVLNPCIEKNTLDKVADLAKSVFEAELDYPYCYQIITALDHLYLAYQMVLEEIYHDKPSSFVFLRGKDDKLCTRFKDFFTNFPALLNKKGVLNDSDPKISYQLISASLGLETALEGDSATSIFLQGVGAFQKELSLDERQWRVATQLVEALPFKCNQEQKEALYQLISRCPHSRFGVLIQFFIPKEDVSRYLYAAKQYGYVDAEHTKDLHAFFQEYQQARKSPRFDPQKNYQVRLLAGALRNQKVQMIRYTLISEDKLISYHRDVCQTLKRMAIN